MDDQRDTSTLCLFCQGLCLLKGSAKGLLANDGTHPGLQSRPNSRRMGGRGRDDIEDIRPYGLQHRGQCAKAGNARTGRVTGAILIQIGNPEKLCARTALPGLVMEAREIPCPQTGNP